MPLTDQRQPESTRECTRHLAGRHLMASGNDGKRARRLLRSLQWATDGPTRSDYEAYLREHSVLAENETLTDRPELSDAIYRDWQRRPQVACVFARQIASRPGEYGVESVIVAEDPSAQMTGMIDATAEAVVSARGTHEGLTVLLPKLIDSNLLVAFCKRLGARNGNWRIQAVYNPSDRLNRVHVSVRFALGDNVEAEILGFGPFTFLPATRRAPITTLEFRTKKEGAKPRGGSKSERSHLADIPWPKSNKQSLWTKTETARRTVLGGDDSAARARITFAIPRPLWDGHDK